MNEGKNFFVRGDSFESHVLNELLPGCLNSITKEYEISNIVDHSFHVLYKVRWKGYAPDDDCFLAPEDISNQTVLEYNNNKGIEGVKKSMTGVIKRNKLKNATQLLRTTKRRRNKK